MKKGLYLQRRNECAWLQMVWNRRFLLCFRA